MESIALRGANFCTTVAGLVGVNGATTLTTAAAALFCVNGKAFSKAAATGGAAPTLDTATGVAFKPVLPGYGCVFVIGSIAGTDSAFAAVQGEITQLNANAGTYVPGAFLTAPEFPVLPDTFCAIGYIVVQVGANFTPTTGWQFGVSNTKESAYNSAATSFLPTPVSVMVLPARPQIS